MKRILKMVTIVSALVIILVVSVASVAMAAGPNPEPGTCPNPDCPGVCPNPDGSCDGDQLQYRHQNGKQDAQGSQFQYRYRLCQVD
jgi:hypothetical protein